MMYQTALPAQLKLQPLPPKPKVKLVIDKTADSKQQISKGTKTFKLASIALFLLGFASFSLIYGVQPLFPNFSQDFSVNSAESSLMLSLTTGFLSFAILMTSAFAVGISRKQLMFWSMLIAAILNAAIAKIYNWEFMLVVRAAMGVVLGGVPAVAMAWLSEEIESKDLPKAMGIYVAGTAFGAMLGRVGMGLLTEYVSWRAAMAAMGGLCIIAALGFLYLLPNAKNTPILKKKGFAYHAKAWLSHLKVRALQCSYIMGFLFTSVFVTLFNYATFRLAQAPYNLSPTQISLIFLTFALGMVSSSISGYLIQRFQRTTIMAMGYGLLFVGGLVTLHESLYAIIAGVSLCTMGFFTGHSATSSFVGKTAKEHKGHATALYLLFYYLGSSVMGTIGGWVWDFSGWGGVVLMTSGVCIAGLAVVSFLKVKKLA